MNPLTITLLAAVTLLGGCIQNTGNPADHTPIQPSDFSIGDFNYQVTSISSWKDGEEWCKIDFVLTASRDIHYWTAYIGHGGELSEIDYYFASDGTPSWPPKGITAGENIIRTEQILGLNEPILLEVCASTSYFGDRGWAGVVCKNRTYPGPKE